MDMTTATVVHLRCIVEALSVKKKILDYVFNYVNIKTRFSIRLEKRTDVNNFKQI